MEYDLARSSIQGGIQLRNTAKVEQTAVPTGCMWLPPGVQGAEPAVITANDQYKLRSSLQGPSRLRERLLDRRMAGR